MPSLSDSESTCKIVDSSSEHLNSKFAKTLLPPHSSSANYHIEDDADRCHHQTGQGWIREDISDTFLRIHNDALVDPDRVVDCYAWLHQYRLELESLLR